jgi:hypothetical protein
MEVLPPSSRGAAALLRSDDLAPTHAQGVLLHFEVMVGRAHAGVADDGHIGPLSR